MIIIVLCYELHAQIALSLVMGKLVELTGLTHYYIIVACLGTWQRPVFHLRNIKCFGSGFILCGSLSTLLADSGNLSTVQNPIPNETQGFFTGLERLLTFL
jgi:hypothetical protein